jgi:putative (di)nucleoside polyphosphate hydrolase
VENILEKPYRPNAGMVVFNERGMLLVGERFQFRSAWQFPQGGIDEGEEPDLAAERELYEEVGISKPELVGIYPEWIYYDFPPNLNLHGKMANYKGQMQKWYLYFWNHPAADCNLEIHDREFKQVQFMDWDSIIDSIVEFKRDVYKKLKSDFKPKIENYLSTRK